MGNYKLMDEQGKTQEKFFTRNYADVIVGEEDTNFDSSSVFTKALRCPRVSCHSNEIVKGGCKAEGAASKSGPCLSPTQLGLLVTCCILLNLGLFVYVAHLQTRIGAIYDLASRAHSQHAVEPQQVSSHRNEVLLSSSKSQVLPQRTKRLIRNPNRCATVGDINELQDSVRKSTHPSAHLSFPEPPARLVSNLLTKNTTYTWTSYRKSFSLHSFFGPSPATAIAISQSGYYYVYGQVTIERKPGPRSSLLSAQTCYYVVYFNNVSNHLFTIMTTIPPESLNRQESVYSGGTFYLPENTKLYLEPYGATSYDCAVYTTPDKTFFGAFKL